MGEVLYCNIVGVSNTRNILGDTDVTYCMCNGLCGMSREGVTVGE